MDEGAQTTRVHVVLPAELVTSVDRLIGRRGRSRFVAEAVAEKLARLRRVAVFGAAAGTLAGHDLPEWDDAAAWVRRSRAEDGSGRSRADGEGDA